MPSASPSHKCKDVLPADSLVSPSSVKKQTNLHKRSTRELTPKDLAQTWSWEEEDRIVVVNDDLNVSSAHASKRLGFTHMLEMITCRQVAVIFTVHADR